MTFPIACKRDAIPPADLPRYRDLTNRLSASVQKRRELSGGYALTLNPNTITFTEAAEWIALERLCCPFLSFQLSTSGNQPEWSLHLTGPDGVKAILRAEFP